MKKLLFSSLAVVVLLISCNKQDSFNSLPVTPTEDQSISGNKSLPTNRYSGEYVRNYFTLLCKIAKSTKGFFPPQVARAYGYIGIANYEAVVRGIPGAKDLIGQLNGLEEYTIPKLPEELAYNWAIASNAAIAETMRRMFEINISAENATSIDSAENTNLSMLSQSVNPAIVSRSISFGKKVAANVYLYSKKDGGHQSYLDPFQLPYTMPAEPYCWLPTGPVTTPVSPRWGDNRPFIKSDVDGALVFQHIPFSTEINSAFYKEAMKVYTQVKNNTPDQVTIAKYWADDPFNTCTPAGHTFNILTQLLKENNATLAKTSVAYAKLCIAENDAFISCWKGKYSYSLLRPVTYIQKNIDPSFATVIGTPAFPSYTSGHSCEMGAGAMVFTNMFTDGTGKYNFTDYSQLQYGFEPRTYTNFNAMAEECANSRFYGGIHYPMDNEDGLAIGKQIGENVNNAISWPQNTN